MTLQHQKLLVWPIKRYTNNVYEKKVSKAPKNWSYVERKQKGVEKKSCMGCFTKVLNKSLPTSVSKFPESVWFLEKAALKSSFFLRAAFSKNQTGSDSDVGKYHPKSYILFITFVKHPIQLFFHNTFAFSFYGGSIFWCLWHYFFINFVGIAFDGSNWEFLILFSQYI